MERDRTQESHSLPEREKCLEREVKERMRGQDMIDNDGDKDMCSILMWFDERNDVKREGNREHFQPTKSASEWEERCGRERRRETG